LPTSANATTVNKVCASGLEAINQSGTRDPRRVTRRRGGWRHGEHEPGPHLLPKARLAYRMGNATVPGRVLHDGLWSPWDDHHDGMSAEAIAEKRGITREEQDECALRSHQRAMRCDRRRAVQGGDCGQMDVPARRGTTFVDT